MNKKGAAVTAAVVLCTGVAIMAAAALYKKYKYDKFESVAVQAGAESDFTTSTIDKCTEACNADPECRGFSWSNSVNGCRPFDVDPYTNWSESFDIDTYIKRDSDVAASSWSAWDPPQCPGIPGVGDWCGTVVQHRTCTGSCIGSSENHCPAQACPDPDVYESLGQGWEVLPAAKISAVETDGTATDCQALCDKDKSCKGFWYYEMHGLGKNTCAKIQTEVTGVMPTTTGLQAVNNLYLREPADTRWGPMPNPSGCKCGVSKLDRTCESSQCKGPGYVQCPKKACSYDKFERVIVG